MGAPSDSPTSPAPTDLEPPVDLLCLRAAAFASAIDSIVVTDPTRPDNPIVDVNAAFER